MILISELLILLVSAIILSMLVLAPPRTRIFIAIAVIALLFTIFPPLLIPIGLGLIVALIALMPPFHRLGKKFPTVRLSLAFLLGLISFIILYSVITYDMAHHRFADGEYQYECQSCDYMIYVPFKHTEEELENQQAIIMEYWTRELLLPTTQTSCNTGNPLACRFADEILSRRGWDKFPSWSDFFINFLISHLATISTIFFVVIFTRSRHKDTPLAWI